MNIQRKKQTITVFSYSSDEDEFKPIEVKPHKELRGYNVVRHEKYGTTSIYVVDEGEKTRPWGKYCTILGFVKTKYGEQKSEVRLQSPYLVCDLKMWETLINGGLELLIMWVSRIFMLC